MPSAPVIMALVALLAGGAGIAVFVRAAPSEASVYRHRIAGTMLVSLSAILFAYAWALHSWSAAA